MRPAVNCCRRARGNDASAGFAALRSHLDQPVGASDHIQVVLDDQQRVAAVQQLVEGAHQLRDVLEVQAGGGLIEDQQPRSAGAESARWPASFRRCASPPESVGTGCPSRT